VQSINGYDFPINRCAELLKTTGVMCMVDIKAHTGIQGNVAHSMAPFLYAGKNTRV